jgi:hypothetical protein
MRHHRESSPQGQISSRGQDTQLPAAFEHAATRLAEVAREFSHRQPTPEFRPVVVADPRDERALASGVNDESIRDDAGQNVERREHHVRRVPRGELWKPPGARDESGSRSRSIVNDRFQYERSSGI